MLYEASEYVVEVAPYTYGSRLIETLGRNTLFGFFIGPMAADLAPEEIAKLPQINKPKPGIILSNESWIGRVLAFLTRSRMPRREASEVKKHSGAKEVIDIRDHHWNIFHNTEVCYEVMEFLKTGRF